MRYRSPHAAVGGSVPSASRGHKSRRALLAATAGAIGLLPVALVASPAFAGSPDSNLTTYSASSGTITEGSSVTITLTAAAAAGYDITTAGTATSGTDYTALTTAQLTQTFSVAGTKTIVIQTIDDQLYEGSETIIVRATNQSTADYSEVTVTVSDNDNRPSYTLSATTGPITEGVGAKATITATLSAVSGLNTVVTLNTQDGTATAGVAPLGDYTALAGDTITIAAGSQSGTRDVLITNDLVKDAQDVESFTVNGSGTNVLPTTASTTVSIKDAQTLPKITVSGGGTVAEGASATVTVTTDTKSELPITAQWDAVDVTPAAGNGMATAGYDFTYPSSRTVTIPAGSTSANITIPMLADSLDEYTEEYAIQISNPVNASLGATVKATGSITDGGGDVAPTVSIAPTSVTEGDSGKKTQTFTATLSGQSGKTVKVDWATGTGGTATAGKDFMAASGKLTFTPGTTSQTFTVDIIGDTLDEGASETFPITTTDVANSTISASGPTTITIVDDDAAPTLTVIDDKTMPEGNDSSVLLLPVKLSNPSDHALTFDIISTPGTAVTSIGAVGTNDYTLLNNTVTIAPEMTTGYIAVLINGDSIYEADESATVTATAQAGSTGQDYMGTPYQRIATITLKNDDKAPDLEVNSVTGKEGDTVTVTGTVTGISATSTTVNVSFLGGSVKHSRAADSNDFTNPGVQSVTIPAGTPPGSILTVGTVALTKDDVAEPAETIVASGYGTGGVGSVTDGVIEIEANGDLPKPTIDAPAKVVGASTVEISGKATANTKVELWGAPVGDELAYITSTTSNGKGEYSFSRKITEGHKFAVQANLVNSDEATVLIQQDPAFTASTTKGSVSFSITPDPLRSGKTVYVQKFVNNAWTNAWTGKTTGNVAWKGTFKVTGGTALTVRAYVPGDPFDGILPGYSKLVKLTVKK